MNWIIEKEPRYNYYKYQFMLSIFSLLRIFPKKTIIYNKLYQRQNQKNISFLILYFIKLNIITFQPKRQIIN
jgi:hypothetical protein